VTLSSLKQLAVEIRASETEKPWLDVDDLAARFRANFVLDTGQANAYTEESWRAIRIGDHLLQVG
jgi:uncharacterized protein YcbX